LLLGVRYSHKLSFFFQAEDGIRVFHVTGVQTCALPISWIVVVVAGISAALHIWKLPAALPMIQEDLGLSLLAAGVLLGIVQVAEIGRASCRASGYSKADGVSSRARYAI